MDKVFVLGVNRSGTHLIMSLLSGHPDLIVTGLEDGMLKGLERDAGAFEAALKSRRLFRVYRAIAGNTRYLALKIMSLKGEAWASNARDSIAFNLDFDALDQRFLDHLQDEDDPRLLKIKTVAEVIDAFYSSFAFAVGQSDKRYVVAKPTNGAMQFGAVADYFEDDAVRLVCMVRDPRDIVTSMLKLNPKSSIEIICQGWLAHVKAMRRLAYRFPVHVVRYEAVCQATEETMMALCEFLGISYEFVVEKPRFHDKKFSGNSSFDSLEGVSTASIERWRTALSTRQVMDIEAYVGPFLEQFGYEPQYSGIGQAFRASVVAVRRVIATLLQSLRQSRRWAAVALFGAGILAGVIFGQVLFR